MKRNDCYDWIGESGRSYPCSVWGMDCDFPGPGIYIYAKWIPLINVWKCIYIGRTENIAKRLNEHRQGKDVSDPRIFANNPTHIHIHSPFPEDQTEEGLERIEKDLIAGQNPPCNTVGKKKSFLETWIAKKG